MSMEQYNSHIEAVVMRRVRSMYLLRTYSAPVLSAAIALLALWGIGREVWVAHVFQNFNIELHAGNVARFLEVAFLDTRLAVQVLVIAVLVAGLWFAVNMFKLLKETAQYA